MQVFKIKRLIFNYFDFLTLNEVQLIIQLLVMMNDGLIHSFVVEKIAGEWRVVTLLSSK
jgi:hypothetical protein